jgi:hypothetical protein
MCGSEVSLTFGLIIDENDTPGLHPSVEAAKSEVEKEMAVFYGPKFWADHNCYVVWSYPVDADYETPTAYLGNDKWLADDFMGFQVWEVMLWDSDSLTG